MTNDVYVLVEHSGTDITDPTFELAGKARALAAGWGGEAVAVSLGSAEVSGLAVDRLLRMEHQALDSYSPQAFLEAVASIIAERDPKLVLIANTTMGMDLGAALAGRWGKPLAAYVTEVAADGADVVATSQVYGGKLLAETVLDGGQGVCTVIAGSFPAADGKDDGPGAAETVEAPASLGDVGTTLVALREPEAGDVDITAQDILVAIGRGIESEDNIELAQEVADALGAAVAASRPITDSGWLPKSRQVGKSGLKVKPKAYLCFGISGAPEHLEGMRDAELIIACNIDEQAPIFDVAHYGSTADLFDLLPALAEKVAG
jgi:electron transfer flavoprotein alpha subunit